MPLWIKIAIIAILGIGLSIGSYFFVNQKLDAEHEQYVRGLVVTHSAPSKDAIVIGEEPKEDDDTATKAAIDILVQGQQTDTSTGPDNTSDNQEEIVRKRIEHSDLSIEIGIVTFDDVEFQVGESWQSDDGAETYTITKIIKTPKQVQLYYETSNGTEYVFVLDQTNNGGYVIQGADEIAVSVDTNPGNTDPNPESNDINQTSTTTQNTSTNNSPNTNSNTPTSTTPQTSTSTAPVTTYVVVDTATTTTPTTPTSTQTTTTSTTPTATTTTPVINTTPTTTTEQAQPYNDGTYQYKANPDYIPYTPPLYDRDYGAEVGVDS